MPTTRREISERKNAMLRDLRSAHQHGVAMPGEMALSQRELSAKYNLSIRTISIELQKLVEEGVLYTVPRLGTFVGRPQTARDNLFLALFRYLHSPNIQWSAICGGFEDQIASLGGTSAVLDYDTARRYQEAGETVAPAGVFEMHDLKSELVWSQPGVPLVEFGELHAVHPGSDAVYFDNSDGGWKATRHLLSLGHRKIAFMALHSEQEAPGFFLWSQEREAGWRRALHEANLSADGLAFRPEHTPEVIVETLGELSLGVAAQLLAKSDITAVVAVNAHAAHALFQQLQATGRPSEEWPAVVGFDTELAQSPDDAMHIVTALRLPWEQIGREAANLLWERSRGLSNGPRQRLVPMTLIPRLSCRQEWHRVPRAMARPKDWVAAAP